MIDTVRAFAVKWLLEPTKKVADIMLIIRKTDGNGNYVKGARLELDFNTNTDADKAVVSGADSLKVYINSTTSALELVTGEQPITIDKLLPGRYYLYELKAPNGYLQADSMGFVINLATIPRPRRQSIK